jgi:hypothetical protein
MFLGSKFCPSLILVSEFHFLKYVKITLPLGKLQR